MNEVKKDFTKEDIALLFADGNKEVAREIAEKLAPVTDELRKAYERIEELSKTQTKLMNLKLDKGEDKNRYKSFGEELSEIGLSIRQGVMPERLKTVHNLGDASLGSFLIQEDFANELSGGLFETGILTDRVTTVETANNMLNINSLKEASRVTGYRLGGVRAYWEGELDEVIPSNTKFKRQVISLDKLMGSFQVSDETLQDIPYLQSYITKLFLDEFSFQLDLGIIKGTGLGMPLGILNSESLLTQARDGKAISADELLEMENKVKNRTKAAWYGNRSVLPGLRRLKIGTDAYAFTGQGLHGLPTDQLLGKEFVELEQLPYVTSANSLILANMEDYMLFKKTGGVNSAQSIHVDFLKELSTFRFSMRVSGRPMYDEPIKLYDGTSEVSSFVSVQAES